MGFLFQALQQLMSSTDNELFAHYIFMDNSFSLPTAAGLPLKFALSGTFVPGAKGGLHIAPNMVNSTLFVVHSSIKSIECILSNFIMNF